MSGLKQWFKDHNTAILATIVLLQNLHILPSIWGDFAKAIVEASLNS